jgi:hypothetical protein
MSIAKDFLNTAIRRLKYYRELGEKALDQLSEEQFHYSPNSTVNSIAIIIQHLSGNMVSRWTNFLTEDGEKKWRQRDGEFEVHPHSRAALMVLWHQGWDRLFTTLEELKKDDLKKMVHIREEKLTVIDAINRQLAHYPYHIGQIITMGKIVRGEDWQNLSIPKKGSENYNAGKSPKDPAKKY